MYVKNAEGFILETPKDTSLNCEEIEGDAATGPTDLVEEDTDLSEVAEEPLVMCR